MSGKGVGTTSSVRMPDRAAASENSGRPVGTRDAVVLFDGVCNLCNGFVNFVVDRDPQRRLSFAWLQSRGGMELREKCRANDEELETILFVEGGKCYARSDAVLRILRRLRWPYQMAFALIVLPRPIRDRMYFWVVRNRYRWFGRSAECRVPTPELRSRILE